MDERIEVIFGHLANVIWPPFCFRENLSFLSTFFFFRHAEVLTAWWNIADWGGWGGRSSFYDLLLLNKTPWPYGWEDRSHFWTLANVIWPPFCFRENLSFLSIFLFSLKSWILACFNSSSSSPWSSASFYIWCSKKCQSAQVVQYKK
jgi:hypothetical protein